jgi:endonuclease/exonuclease/phosphatase family metal-dependent hydrolase
LIVYGTVIAWANEKQFDDGQPARMWQVHRVEVERQVAEWSEIAASHPNVPFVIAGDFNQDRDGSGWYGDRQSRERITQGLQRIDATCVTAADVVADGILDSQHLVDHVCASNRLAHSARMSVIDRFDSSGQRLSDHPVVAVDLDFP